MEKICLENFSNIKNFDCELSSVLIFSGDDYVNKINMARIITLFRNWEFQGKLIDYKSLFNRFSIRNLFTPFTRIEYESDKRKITFNGEYFEVISKISKVDENIREEEIFKNQVIGIIQKALDEGGRSKSAEYLYNKLSKLKVNINSMVVIPSQRSMVSAFSEVFASLKGTNLTMQNNLSDFLGRWNIAREELGTCNLEPFGIDYIFEDNEDRIYEKGQFISNLHESSSVVQSVLPLKLVLDYYKKVSLKNQKSSIKDLKTISFLVEEPELHLHSKWFPYIVQLILDTCNLNELIITTNHPEISDLIIKYNEKSLGLNFEDGMIVKT